MIDRQTFMHTCSFRKPTPPATLVATLHMQLKLLEDLEALFAGCCHWTGLKVTLAGSTKSGVSCGTGLPDVSCGSIGGPSHACACVCGVVCLEPQKKWDQSVDHAASLNMQNHASLQTLIDRSKGGGVGTWM